MSDYGSCRTTMAPQPKYYPPPPVALPRSQYANTVRSNMHRPTPGADPPRYFSSPFRAPLNPQERHDSLVEHQKSISVASEDSGSLPRPQFAQQAERTSYTFFEPKPNIDATHSSEQSKQILSVKQKITDASQSSQLQPGVVRQASIGHRVKPALTEVRRSDSTQTSGQYSEPQTPPPKADTIDALNAAIAAAIKSAAYQSTTPSISHDDGNARGSPTSTYSQDFHHLRKSNTKSRHIFIDQGRVLPVEEETRTPSHTEPDRSSPSSRRTPYSEKSASSANPLLGLGIVNSDMNSRVPEDMRPPRLNMKAVRDMESRGSITSLPDLIRRATRLAANLDRGKTASRLGLWDMFGDVDHATARKRESTFSDVLNSFPEPKNSTPPKATRPTTLWPIDPERMVVVSEKEENQPKKQPRKCCGLSMTAFIVVTVIVIILIAAAVIIPVFLVAVPRQNRASDAGTNNCGVSLPCQNKGISIVDNGVCSCVCVGNFTGNDCSRPGDPNCVTANVVDKDHKFENATLGSSVSSLLAYAQGKTNIPLNASVLLAVFANNNLSCAAENSLVQFNTASKRKDRRFVIVAGLPPIDSVNPRTSLSAQPVHQLSRRAPDAQAGDGGIQTSSEAVYQTTSSGASPTQASTTAVGSTTTAATSSTTSSSVTVSSVIASPTPRVNNTITSAQLQFAGLVVLFILGESRAPSTAVTAQQNIEQYLLAGGVASGNKSVEVGHMDKGPITANFENLAIVLGDGTIVGGPLQRI